MLAISIDQPSADTSRKHVGTLQLSSVGYKQRGKELDNGKTDESTHINLMAVHFLQTPDTTHTFNVQEESRSGTCSTITPESVTPVIRIKR